MTVVRNTVGLVYSGDFEALSLGNVDGKDSWEVMLGAGSPNFDTDLGTWDIVAGKYLHCTSAGGYHRCHNEHASVRDFAMVARVKTPTNNWMGLRWGVQYPVSGSYSEYALVTKSGSTDGLYTVHGGTRDAFEALTAPTFSVDTWYRLAVDYHYDGSRHVIAKLWADNLSSSQTLFSGTMSNTSGPTTAGFCGVEVFSAAADYDWLVVLNRDPVTMTGLSGSQGFRIFDSSDTLLASSSTQSGGSATADLLAAGVVDGYVQVYNDAGTWASTLGPDGRYTGSSISQGDVFELLPTPASLYAQIVHDETITDPEPADWFAEDSDIIGVQCCITSAVIEEDVGAFTLRAGFSSLTFYDPDQIYVPTKESSPLYPNVASGRRIRVFYVDSDGTVTPFFYGLTREIEDARRPALLGTVRMQLMLSFLATFRILVPVFATDTPIYDYTDGDTIAASVLTQVLEQLPDDIPASLWDIAVSGGAEYGTLPEDWGGTIMPLGSALAYLAQQGQFIWYQRNLYRTDTEGSNWELRIEPALWKAGQPADLTWDAEAGDIQENGLKYTDVAKF